MAVADTLVAVADTQMMVADVHRRVLAGQEGISAQNHSVGVLTTLQRNDTHLRLDPSQVSDIGYEHYGVHSLTLF